jgi:hypothetical protein
MKHGMHHTHDMYHSVRRSKGTKGTPCQALQDSEEEVRRRRGLQAVLAARGRWAAGIQAAAIPYFQITHPYS